MSSKRPPPKEPTTGMRIRLPKPSRRLDFDGGHGFSEEEEPTRITCPACGGHWKIVSETGQGVKMSTCRAAGCVQGGMRPADAAAWRAAHKR
jgi:hypothetical protein